MKYNNMLNYCINLGKGVDYQSYPILKWLMDIDMIPKEQTKLIIYKNMPILKKIVCVVIMILILYVILASTKVVPLFDIK